jgi:hypothetical protein
MWMADTAEVTVTTKITTVTTAEDPRSIFLATATDEAGTHNITASEVLRVAGLAIPGVAGTAAMEEEEDAAAAAGAGAGAMGEGEDDDNRITRSPNRSDHLMNFLNQLTRFSHFFTLCVFLWAICPARIRRRGSLGQRPTVLPNVRSRHCRFTGRPSQPMTKRH